MKTIVKLSIASCVILVIGAVFLIANPSADEPVQNADADIASWGFAPKTQQQKFLSGLKNLGFEKPRKYNWNGNDVWFSTTVTPESPREAALRIQTEMKENGTNRIAFDEAIPRRGISDKNFRSEMEARAPYMVEMLGGGIVPMEITDERFLMVGNSTKNNARDGLGLATELRDAIESGNLGDLTHQMRYIDGHAQKNGTRLTAVWSGDDLVEDKIVNRGEGINVDTEAMVCPGCERITRMVGEDGAYDTTLIDAGYREPRDIYRFYHQALTNRGWSTGPETTLLEGRRLLKGERSKLLASYSREGEFLTLTVFRDDGGVTTASLMRSP